MIEEINADLRENGAGYRAHLPGSFKMAMFSLWI